MKINLTKLLEKTLIREDDYLNRDQTDASYLMRKNYDVTSSEDAYSFELEKETFKIEPIVEKRSENEPR
jgi:hypothetical protein